MADITGPLVVPTGGNWIGWDTWDGCRFAPTDLAWNVRGDRRAV